MSTTDRTGEETLEQVLEERNRLWAELQRLRSQERELEHWRSYALSMERSLWWRITEPLRRFLRDPAGFLVAIAKRVLRRDDAE